MNLKSGYPYWAVKNGPLYAFPRRDADLSCDEAVVGAGSSGAGRLLVGGEADDRDLPASRDRLVDRKATTLQRKVVRLLPHLHARPAFAWAGTFAETSDGLPLFGRHPQFGPRVLFALAYGGNGITYSMLGAGLLRALIERRPHPLPALFAFDRLG